MITMVTRMEDCVRGWTCVSGFVLRLGSKNTTSEWHSFGLIAELLFLAFCIFACSCILKAQLWGNRAR